MVQRLVLVVQIVLVSFAVCFDEFDLVLRQDRSAFTNLRTTEYVEKDRRNGDRADITLAIFFDPFPQDIGFTLSTADGDQDQETTVLTRQPGSFNETDYANSLYTETIKVFKGQTYQLSVVDHFGDGIWIPGFFGVYYGKNTKRELFRVNNFATRMQNITFVASLQQPKTPTLSPVPTHAPTGCLSEDDQPDKIADRTRDYKPRFKTTESENPRVDVLCTQHTSYENCTSEWGEDCQWVFLPIGERKGLCRVDPIAKCLQNGNCQCNTEDFKGGSADMGQGLLFHVPISVTSRDIGPLRDQSRYYEQYTFPDDQEGSGHPQDPDFFISRVDFSARTLHYEFDITSRILWNPESTISFQIHFLYMDQPMLGTIWSGPRLLIQIDTTTVPEIILINHREYTLPERLRKWTCTSVVITNKKLYIAGAEVERDLDNETSLLVSPEIVLGPFTGELFDARIYKGTLNDFEIRELGARCASKHNPASLKYTRDIENPYFVDGCNPDFLNGLHAGEGGPEPSDGSQTYGSHAFTTLWIKPTKDPLDPAKFVDIEPGQFDEELYFEQSKLQSYIFERFYFELDFIAFNQEPYRWHQSEEVPTWSQTFWNNPCRYMNNFNTGWQFPIYDRSIPRWNQATENTGVESSPFDLGEVYRNRTIYAGTLSFWVHEIYHGLQGHIVDLYSGTASRFLAESTAEFAASLAFPTHSKILAPFLITPGYPLGFIDYQDSSRGQHFMTEEMSLNEWVRGGTIYGAWVLWWFLVEHVGLPDVIARIYSNWHKRHTFVTGELFYLRELIENNNMDFGDVWSIALAHFRTWDFPYRSDEFAQAELEDFNFYLNHNDFDPLPPGTTLESRKTTVEIDPVVGTNGEFRFPPSKLRPGPLGWNSLAIRNVAPFRYISVSIRWEDGMGFSENIEPDWLSSQQAGCDDDPRFYHTVVVAYNIETKQRRYWKMRGKRPQSLYIQTNTSVETIHILLVPTPPSDYVLGRYVKDKDDGSSSRGDDRVDPIPVYNYRYRVHVLSTLPIGAELSSSSKKQHGILKFEEATPGWWPVRCTCIDNVDSTRNRCVHPTFDGVPETTSNGGTDSTFNTAVPPSIDVKPTTPADTGRTGSCKGAGGRCSQDDECCSGHCLFVVCLWIWWKDPS